MFSLLVLLFTIIPAIEIYLLFSIGGQIGGLNTMLIVILTGIVGASLAKSQGLAIINKVQTDLQSGSIPTDQFMHGLLVFGGGLLLLTPGFLTDILGISMVFPGTRHIIALFLKDILTRAVANGNVSFSSFGSKRKPQSYSSQSNDEQEHSRNEGPRQVSPDVFEADFKEKK